MAHDITVIIDDLPGALAKIGETLGNSGVNIDMVYMGPTLDW